jgi:hypothetical protein
MLSLLTRGRNAARAAPNGTSETLQTFEQTEQCIDVSANRAQTFPSEKASATTDDLQS